MARIGLTSEKVVRAAAELCDEVGFDRLTLSGLARRFGVKDASLYSHVKNLAGLREQVAVLSAAEFSQRLGHAVAGRSGREAFTAFAAAYRDYAREHPGRYTSTHLQLPPEIGMASAGHRRLIDLTYATLRGFAFEEPELTDAVRLLRSTLHGFCHLETIEGFGHPRDLDASWDRMLDALYLTLARWPTAT